MDSYAIIRRIIKGARRLKRIEQSLLLLHQKVDPIMPTLDDILEQEKAEGEDIAALVALTDKIFAMLSTTSSDDPRVQQVLDLISANRQQATDAVARDTPAV